MTQLKPKLQRRQRPPSRRKPLTANLTDTVVLDKKRVDIDPKEMKLLHKPVRPSTWKPKPRHKGGLSFSFSGLKEIKQNTPFRFSIVRAHRPYKAIETHFEKTLTYKNVKKEIILKDMPIDDYSIIVQIKGYRPYVRMIKFLPRKGKFDIPFPLSPVVDPEQEQELLRLNERHPFLKNTRGFLTRFGYLKKKDCFCHQEALCEHVAGALRLFQQTYKLSPRGSITIDTYMLMQRPRCAQPDFPIEESEESSTGPTGTTKQDPIVFSPERWDTFGLRYRLMTGTSDISNEWSIVRGALDRWAQVSPLWFTQTSDPGQSHLEFDFRRPGESGYPFDEGGNKDGNTLAHGFFPQNGLVEFDDHEDWGSTSLPAVSTHEIGHALGLRHSSVEDATMYAWYDSSQESLHEVDVRGIKSLYAPVYYDSGPFVRYPLYAFNSKSGTDSVTIDLGSLKHFLAWGTINMIDTLVDYDRDNMSFIDIFEVDGNRTGWRVSGGDHLGSDNSPGNAYEGAYVGYGRRVTFRIAAGHTSDLEVSGFAIVIVLD